VRIGGHGEHALLLGQDYICDCRFSIGPGLRYRTPLGPIREDWGWKPRPRNSEEQRMIYEAVAYPF